MNKQRIRMIVEVADELVSVSRVLDAREEWNRKHPGEKNQSIWEWKERQTAARKVLRKMLNGEELKGPYAETALDILANQGF